jgi:hypothetical protein
MGVAFWRGLRECYRGALRLFQGKAGRKLGAWHVLTSEGSRRHSAVQHWDAHLKSVGHRCAGHLACVAPVTDMSVTRQLPFVHKALKGIQACAHARAHLGGRGICKCTRPPLSGALQFSFRS